MRHLRVGDAYVIGPPTTTERRETRRGIVGNFFIVLGAFAAVCLPIGPAAAELPPEIMVDRYLIQAELLLSEDDFEGAFEIMGRIIALQKEHDLKLPDEFHFKYAKVALSADSIRAAVESVNRYLSATGKQGEFYKEALELSIQAERQAERPSIKPDETCAGSRHTIWWKDQHPEPGVVVLYPLYFLKIRRVRQ